MKVLTVTLLALVAVVASKNINIEDVIDLEEISAYGYLTKVGIPLADRIRKAEAEGESTRIIGGSGASLGQFPYQAGLIMDMQQGQAVCGGSLLNAWRVLTAAHCWWDGFNQAWRFTVVLGSVTIFTGGTRLQTSDIAMHENWTPSLVRNDVAVIRLTSAVSFTNNISPIALPAGNEINEDYTGSTATASGFGATRDGSGVSSTLNHVDLPVITNTVCWITFPGIIQSSNICTSSAGNRNVCSGDSGGPLAVWRNNRRIVIGVASFVHISGCEAGFPGAFARVTSFVSWINNQL